MQVSGIFWERKWTMEFPGRHGTDYRRVHQLDLYIQLYFIH